MKIIFLCGSLEPGHDGVGDYVRRLAGELIRQGHQVAAVALNDWSVSDIINSTQQAEGTYVEVLRVPALWTEKDRFKYAKKWIYAFDPEWLSLQFVPFSFHPKGLPLKLSNQLAILGKGKRWHIMFHELWIGMNKEASIKDNWMGKMQRQLIKLLLYNVKPEVIHTQTWLYRAYLAKLGYISHYLPLFSNIPIYRQDGFDNDGKTVLVRAKEINFVIFGNIHPDAPVNELVKEVSCYSMTRGVNINLTIVGRSGKETERWEKEWKTAGLIVKLLGEQPPEGISEILGKASFGITTTAFAVAEKSGAVAAMLLHGVPVICVAPSFCPRE
jgi:glycosyltransferase involved in cell wall biosynthesis